MLGILNRNTIKFRIPLCLKNLIPRYLDQTLNLVQLFGLKKSLSTYYSELENFQNKFLKRLTYNQISLSLET